MAKATDIPADVAYSSTVRKVLIVKSDGTAIDEFDVNIDHLDIDKINITDYNTNSESLVDDFDTTSSEIKFSQDVSKIIIHNTSDSDTIYVNFNGEAATTNDYEIEAGAKEFIALKIEEDTGLNILSNNAGGTKVKIMGLWTPTIEE